MKNLLNLLKGAVLVIALAPNALASTELSPSTTPIEETPVISTEYGNESLVLSPYADNLDGEVIEFDSTQEWFDSYAPKPTPELESTIDISQQAPNNTLSDDEQDFYEWVFDGAVYVLVNYVEHGAILKDSVNFVGEQLGIETPDITTIDGLVNFVGEMVSNKVTEFLTYIFDAIWNGIESLF